MTSTPEQLQQDKSNFTWLFVSLFFLGILFLGGTYLFVIFQPTQKPQEPINNEILTNQKQIHTLTNQLNTIKPKDLQKDFTQIDQEMKNL